jgi:hypothetical protein
VRKERKPGKGLKVLDIVCFRKRQLWTVWSAAALLPLSGVGSPAAGRSALTGRNTSSLRFPSAAGCGTESGSRLQQSKPDKPSKIKGNGQNFQNEA